MAWGDLVQSFGNVSAASPLNLAYPITPMAGNLLVAISCSEGASLTIGGTGNAWTQLPNLVSGDSTICLACAYVLAANGVAETVSYSGGTNIDGIIAEFSGSAMSILTDETQTAGLTFSSSISTPDYSVSAGDLSNGRVLGVGASGWTGSDRTAAPGGSWVEVLEATGVIRPVWMAMQIITAEGAVGLAATLSPGNTNWFARMMMFKQAAPAGPGYLLVKN